MAATKSYQALVNGFTFNFTKTGLDNLDLVKSSPSEFHLIKDHRSINAKLVETDSTGKKLKIEVEGEIFDIEIKDELDLLLEIMELGSASNKLVKEIRAPMPGLVLEIAITDGQEVNEGDKILILQAMKMENSIIIHTRAKIRKVVVTAGQAVEKGQVLVELE
ncbi:MAG: biotin carboxyl carrier protein [Chitinophagaceae bacterium]|nr:biotin carboxyl carrier protein [Chitinophagaceae bacterium]